MKLKLMNRNKAMAQAEEGGVCLFPALAEYITELEHAFVLMISAQKIKALQDARWASPK